MNPEKSINIPVTSFDDLVEASRFLSGITLTNNVTSPLEQHFIDVADKHGVIDSLFDERDEDENNNY